MHAQLKETINKISNVHTLAYKNNIPIEKAVELVFDNINPTGKFWREQLSILRTNVELYLRQLLRDLSEEDIEGACKQPDRFKFHLRALKEYNLDCFRRREEEDWEFTFTDSTFKLETITCTMPELSLDNKLVLIDIIENSL